MKKNLFITFEGIDGAGKTTQIAKLSKHFKDNEIDHLITREPGGSEIGDKIRGILKNNKLNPISEVLLLYANRLEHVENVIKPNLKKRMVISDRYNDSTVAYQHYGRAIPLEYIRAVAPDIIEPDLTIYIDISLEERNKRLKKRSLDTIELSSDNFHKNVINGYKNLAKEHKRIKVIDGTKEVDEIFEEILKHINEAKS